MKPLDFSKARTMLEGAGRIAVLSHFDPDADALGSVLGLMHALEESGKEVAVVNESPIHPRYAFLPGVERVVQSLPDMNTIDSLCILDCGDIRRVGDSFLGQVGEVNHKILNIDHHISNDSFGALNLVAPRASSTCEIVYEFLMSGGGFSLTPAAASCLLTGIIGDTGSFRYSNTSARTFQIAADLVERGANSSLICGQLFGRERASAVKLQAEALQALEFSQEGRVATVKVSTALFQKYGAGPGDTEALVERARDIEGVQVSVLLREEAGLWKASLRSTEDRFNVSKLASTFGGGGHAAAAGFRFRGSFEDLQSLLTERIEALFQEAG